MIEDALKGEGLHEAALRRIAETIFEFERNIAHQREIFVIRQPVDDEGAVEGVAGGVIDFEGAREWIAARLTESDPKG